jgi:lysophospholipase L1-like esterase
MKKNDFIMVLLFFVFGIQNQIFSQSYSYGIYPSPPTNIVTFPDWAEKNYFNRIDNVFKKNHLKSTDIVFIGNSITENGGSWASRFESNNVVNRGKVGDETEGVIKRLGEICYYKPAKVFLLIGINDLWRGRSVGLVSQNILNIADTIGKYSPTTKLFVQTILPTTNLGLVSEIKQANDILKANASVKNYTLIDLHSLFADPNDLLKSEYSLDGLHINEAGYSRLVNAARSFVITTSNTSNFTKKSSSNSPQLLTHGHQISIIGADNITIYNLKGSVIESSTNDLFTSTTLMNGVYMVKINQTAQKVIISQ